MVDYFRDMCFCCFGESIFINIRYFGKRRKVFLYCKFVEGRSSTPNGSTEIYDVLALFQVSRERFSHQ